MACEIVGPLTLEVAAGAVEEHQVRPQAAQIPQALVEPHLERVLGRDQAIEGAIPGVQLAVMHLDAAAGVPIRQEASALAIADKVGLQPACQAVLAARCSQSIGDQHQSSIVKPHRRNSISRFRILLM